MNQQAAVKVLLQPRSVMEKRLSPGITAGIMVGGAAVAVGLAIVALALRPKVT